MSRCERFQVEIGAAAMEVDRVSKALPIPLAAGHLRDPFDPSVDRFGPRVRHRRESDKGGRTHLNESPGFSGGSVRHHQLWPLCPQSGLPSSLRAFPTFARADPAREETPRYVRTECGRTGYGSKASKANRDATVTRVLSPMIRREQGRRSWQNIRRQDRVPPCARRQSSGKPLFPRPAPVSQARPTPTPGSDRPGPAGRAAQRAA